MFFDNGLLKCYPEYANKYGMLDVSKLGKLGKQTKVKTLEDTQGIFSGLYYAKICELGELQIEVLLSQLIAEFGVSTCKYFPGVITDKYGSTDYVVVSENVRGDNGKTFHQFAQDNRRHNPKFKSPYERNNQYTTEELNLPKLFTNKGLKEFVDGHIIRTACGDIDGHSENIIVDVVGNTLLTPGRIDGVSLIDYSVAGCMVDEYQKSVCFCNGLGGGIRKDIEDMVDLFKNNEIVQSFYTNSQIAEKLGNIDVHEKAREIQDSMGFYIVPRIENGIARNIDYVAEEMAK